MKFVGILKTAFKKLIKTNLFVLTSNQMIKIIIIKETIQQITTQNRSKIYKYNSVSKLK